MRLTTLAVVLASLSALRGQNTHAAPAFEVVSVKPSASNATRLPKWSGGPGMPESTNLVCSSCPVSLLVLGAFGPAQHYQIVGPNWLDTDLLDSAARVPPNTTREQIVPMLRTMLEQRFHMAAHREPREMPAAELVEAKAAVRLKKAPDTWAPICGHLSAGDLDNGCAVWSYSGSGFTFNGVARIETLVSALSLHLGKPVRDATGLTGFYEFKLAFVPDRATETEFGVPLEKALSSQLGLKLQSGKSRVDMIVIDHIDRDPTGN